MTAKKKTTATAAKKKHPGGRPEKYKAEFCELATNYALLGATDLEMARYFGVSEKTFNNWKIAHKEFLQAIKAGREEADANVGKSLYSRAMGYVGKKTVTATEKGVVTDIRVVDDYVGPETTACIFWLKNRQRDRWRDKQDVNLSVAVHQMSEAEILAELSQLGDVVGS